MTKGLFWTRGLFGTRGRGGLSGREMRRLSVALELVTEPRIFLADEPCVLG